MFSGLGGRRAGFPGVFRSTSLDSEVDEVGAFDMHGDVLSDVSSETLAIASSSPVPNAAGNANLLYEVDSETRNKHFSPPERQMTELSERMLTDVEYTFRPGNLNHSAVMPLPTSASLNAGDLESRDKELQNYIQMVCHFTH